MSILKKWIKTIRQLMFTYEDGFFIFPVFSSDPESIIYGFQHTPMIKYYPEKQLAVSKTPFLEGDAYFRNIEEGLWIIYTQIRFKKNICFKNIYDPEGSSDYYTLSLDTSMSAGNIVHSQDGKEVKITSYTWRLFKPNTISTNYHLKDTIAKLITLYIHKDWFHSNFIESGVLNTEIVGWFNDPNAEVLLLPQSSLAKTVSVYPIFEAFENQEETRINMFELRANILTLINAFVSVLNTKRISDLREIKPKDEVKILGAERLLKESIYSGFPSITKIAKTVGMSETKLKADFKSLFGQTLHQYYSHCQMDVAEELLKTGNESIKSVAFGLGFTHPGKFSSAFKKIKGISPSGVK